MPVSRCGRDLERGGGLLDREPGIVAELDQGASHRVLGDQPLDRFVQGQDLIGRGRCQAPPRLRRSQPEPSSPTVPMPSMTTLDGSGTD